MDIASAATVRSSALLPQKTPSATVSTRPWTKTPDQFLHFRLPRSSWRLPLTGSSLPPRPHPRAAEDPSGPCSLAPLSQPGSSSLGLTRARAHSRLLALATPAVRASSGRPAVGAIPPGRPLTAALTTPPVDTLRTLASALTNGPGATGAGPSGHAIAPGAHFVRVKYPPVQRL
jgi:hypothetical protein